MTRLTICIDGRPELLRLLGRLAGAEPDEVQPSPASEARPTSPRLTNREWEVARLVATGSTNDEIATRMFISRRTVEKHLDNIRSKLGVTSRAKVMAWTMRHDGWPTQSYAEKYV
jgi:DNA-binding NarL/FixJ family response regulator